MMLLHLSKSRVSIAPLMLAAFFLLGLPAAGNAQEGFDVRELNIVGNTVLTADQLKARLTTYATGAFRQHVLGKEAFSFSEDILRTDLQRIVRFYQREGFLYASAEIGDLKSDVENRTVRISLNVTEGDSITIADASWQVADSPSSTVSTIDSVFAARRPLLQATTGRRFRDAAVNSDRQMLAHTLENLGYPFCEIIPDIAVDESNLTATVQWRIRPGPRCRFGSVDVTGNERVPSDLIARRLVINEGDIYSRRALEESQRRIYGLSLFHIVTVSARLTSDRDTLIPVEVLVAEAPQLSSKIGFGYGREEKFRVYSDSYYLGFLGGARRLNLYAKHSSLEPYHVSLKLIQPAFLTSFTSLELQPFVLRQEEPAFTENRYGGNITLLHELSRYMHASVTYTFEHVSLDTTSVADLPEFTSQLRDAYNKSSLLPGITFDNSSPVFSPARGFYIAAAAKVSGLGLGSDYHFTRLLFDARRYQPALGMVLAGRIKVGGIRSNDDHEFVPFEDRFYAGGSASVRGWARAGLGPTADDGTPLGGYSLFEGSVAIRFPIWGIVSGAMFSDFGNVWTESYSFPLDDLRYSAGFGIRVSTPIGPVRLDVARPIFDDETTWQFHISVGEAF